MALTKISTAMWNSVPHHDTHDFNVDDVLYVDVSANRVGIGTTSPNQKLEIRDTAPFLRITTTLNDDSHELGREYGGIEWYTEETYGDAPVVAAYVKAIHTRSGTGHTNGDMGLVFATGTASSNATATERMRIESATGNVGIGTSTPASTLHLYSASNTQITFQDASTGAASNDGFRVGWNGTVAQMYLFENADMRFATNDTERMRITSGGDISFRDTSNNEAFYWDASAASLGIGGIPTEQLHLINTNDAIVKIESSGTDASDDARIELTTTNGTFSIQNDRSLGASGALTFAGNTSNNIVIDHNTGNVGIGTPSPASNLEVSGQMMITSNYTSGKQSNHYLYIGGDGIASTNAAIYIGNKGDGSGYGWELFYEGTGSGINNKFKLIAENLGSPVTALTALQDGKIGIGATSPSEKLEVAGNVLIKDGSNDVNLYLGNSSYGFNLDYSTGDISIVTNGTKKLTVDLNGNVGIGINNPSNTTHIYKNATIGPITSTTTANAGLRIQDNGASMYFDGNSIVLDNTGYLTTNGAHDFVLGTNNTARIHIDSGGNIGIGVTNPVNKLEVVSSVNNVANFRSTTANSLVFIGDTTSTTSYSLLMFNSNSGTAQIWKSGTAYTSWGGASALNIYNSNGAIALHPNGTTNALFLSTSGNVTANVDMRAPIFYDSNNTSYYVNPAGSSNMSSIALNGSSYTSGIDSVTDAALVIDRGLKIYNDDGNYLRSILQFDTSAQINVGQGGTSLISSVNLLPGNAGYVYAANQMRAPIFYDSNNTGYYVDPNSTSSLVNIAMDGELRLHSHGSTKFYRGSGDAADYNNQNVVLAGWNGLGLYNPTTGGAFTNQTTGFYDFRNGIFDVKGSFRAPIFYDSNNTNRYIDPASTSSLLNINMNNGTLSNVNHITINDPGVSEGIQWIGGNDWRIYESPDAMTNASGNLQFTQGTTFRFRIDTSGNTFSSGSSRAPIFYDSDNTGYYVDPASTSNLNTTSSDLFTAGQLRFKGVGGNSGQTAYDYAIYQAAGAWSYPYPDLIVGWHTGIRIGAYWNYGGIRFYNNSPESAGATEIFSVGNGDDHVRVANYLYAPIVYDSNDTGYYVDPASTSNLNKLQVDEVYHSKILATITAAGWYTIAINSSQRAFGTFILKDVAGGRHQTTVFTASIHYGANGALTLTHNDYYSSSPFRYIRIKEGSTYDGAMLQLYFDTSSTVEIFLQDNIQDTSWTLKQFVPDGTDPGGLGNYSALTNISQTIDIDLAARGGIVGTGPIVAQSSMRSTTYYDYNNTAFYAHLDSTGDAIRAAGDVIAYYSSDKRLKDNIVKIDAALDKVNTIGGYTFEWNEESHKETGSKDIGVIAQEVEEIFPEIVQTRSNGYKAVNYEKLVPLLIEAIKELSEKVKILENK